MPRILSAPIKHEFGPHSTQADPATFTVANPLRLKHLEVVRRHITEPATKTITPLASAKKITDFTFSTEDSESTDADSLADTSPTTHTLLIPPPLSTGSISPTAFPVPVHAIMREYCAEHGTVSEEEASRLLELGATITTTLSSGDITRISALAPSDENCKALIFFLYSKSFETISAPFSRGVIRVLGHSSGRIIDFLERNPRSYARISTHFKEMTVGRQRGLDFETGELYDSELKTILFGKLSDGSCFIKCETEGTSILRNPLGAILHLRNWATKAIFGRTDAVGGMATRREKDCPKELKRLFKQVVTSGKEASSAARDRSLRCTTPKPFTKRVFQKVTIVDHIEASLKTGRTEAAISSNPRLSKLARDIEDFKLAAARTPRASVISGNEVLLDSARLTTTP